MSSILIALTLLLTTVPQHPPSEPTADAAVQEHVRQLIKSLPTGSRWRDMLEHGMRGDGIHRAWMDQMKKDGIELALFTFEFAWTDGGRKLKDWTLVSDRYFRDYDESQPVLEQQLKFIRDDGLQQELAAAALPLAKNANWIEYPSEESGQGYRLVYLADNEWLPVNLPPTFGEYEPGTTPLMHAAMLGDDARIKKLLAQGMSVDATRPDGMTALMYAAGSGNPAAVEMLLRAGAHVTRKTKEGDDALINAAAGGDLRSVGLLLKAGADPNSRDVEGQSALSIATQRHYADVAKLLEQAGARE